MEFKFPKKRLCALIYSQPCMGKSVALVTLLKIPGLKVRLLVLEDNSLPAIEEGLKLHNITSLEEGQFTIAEVKGGGISSTDKFIDQTDESSYINAVSKLLNFSGFDVATSKDVKLGNTLNWGNDTVLCIDGLTMLQYACGNRGHVKAVGNKDPRAAFYAGQDALLGYVYQLMQNSKAHIVVLGHETTSDEVALSKHKQLMATHPALGTRSIVSPFLGRFNNVLYAKLNKQTKKYVWSVEEDRVMTAHRNIVTKDNPYEGKPVTLNNLPADFSYSGYHWFDL